MSVRRWVDGAACDQVPADDRGLAYGDGLFETLWVEAGRPRLWPLHLARLGEGCRRLAIPLPQEAVLLDDIRGCSAGFARATVRLSLTRGSGPRGYAPPAVVRPRRLVSAAPASQLQAVDGRMQGLRLHRCETRWAIQPRLAGIKHLNRLEQVLARAEWTDPQIGEGLMLDMEGRVVSATAANLFACIDGRWVTPDLSRCGVAGVARRWLLDRFRDIEVAELWPRDLVRASELCLSSSLRGVVPVAALAGHGWAPGPRTRALQQAWQSMAARFEISGECEA